jgi:hypothetical protein
MIQVAEQPGKAGWKYCSARIMPVEDTVAALLANNRILVPDGALATQLEARALVDFDLCAGKS